MSTKKRPALSGEAKAAYGEIQKRVAHLRKSIAEIQKTVRRAEHKIEADARARIRELRKEARVQLDAVESRRREASRTLKSLTAAAGESWREIKQSADTILSDASTTAASVIERFRGALGG
jgi:hypothetical protein